MHRPPSFGRLRAAAANGRHTRRVPQRTTTRLAHPHLAPYLSPPPACRVRSCCRWRQQRRKERTTKCSSRHRTHQLQLHRQLLVTRLLHPPQSLHKQPHQPWQHPHPRRRRSVHRPRHDPRPARHPSPWCPPVSPAPRHSRLVTSAEHKVPVQVQEQAAASLHAPHTHHLRP